MQNIIRKIDNDEILALAEPQFEACISLYMPEEQAGRDTRKNAILFKDLCRCAEEKLQRYGIDKSETGHLLAPLKELEQNEKFWQTRDQGLAIFRSKDVFKIYLLPTPFEALEVVDRHFYIRPLLAANVPQSISNVLLVNPEEMKFITLQQHGQQEHTPPDELRSFEKFMEVFEFAEHAQFHSAEGAPRRGDAGLPVFQGEGTADDEAPTDYYHGVYYRKVKNWLAEIPAVNNSTIYLVGDAKNTGLFTRAAEDISCSFEPLIDKNVNAVSIEEIRETVNERNARMAETAYKKSAGDLLQLEANQPERVLTDTGDILAAAHNQRIRTLFIPANNNYVWGHFDEASQGIEVEQDRDQGGVGEELINLAAIRTLLNNGEVVPLPDKVRFEDVPHFAAICRW